MIDSEAISEKRLEAFQYFVPILPNRNHNVGTESVQAGGNGPNVKIMNPFHARHAGHSFPNLFGVQVGRHSFHEHMHGLREKSPRAPDDKDTDAGAEERIDEKPSSEPNRDSTKNDSDRTDRIAEHLYIRTTNIQARRGFVSE